MSAAYLEAKKLTGAAIVRTAARHNLREIQAELGADSHIDASLSRHNLRLAGPALAADVAELADNAMKDAGIAKLRADAVRAVEVVVSLPTGTALDVAAFFADALAWVQSFFAVPVLSAVVHLDEAAPHLHVLLLPLLNGRMVGSDLVGNKMRLQAMQSSFFDVVAGRYGLTKPRAEKRLSRAVRDKAAVLALDCLLSHPERLQWPNVRFALSEALAANPESAILALGLEMPKGKPQRQRSFVEIMTKPCKPEPKPIGFKRQPKPNKPIGFEPTLAAEKSEPYPCVGFAPAAMPEQAANDCESAPANDITRELDEDKAGWVWDEVAGEWMPPAPARARGGARAWAKQEMQRLGMG